MPRLAREKSRSGIYHIMLRGNSGQEIFHDDQDRAIFLEILKKVKTNSGIKVLGWCLMGNHVHLLLQEMSEDISTTMKRLGVSFVSYYNHKYEINGHLFQDRFKSENVETDEYLLTVIRYIHQNPLKAGLVQSVEQWIWSSCLAYYGSKTEPADLLDKELILQMFADNEQIAIMRFKEFNETVNEDHCLDEKDLVRKLNDKEAREKISEMLQGTQIGQVKNLSKQRRDELLRKIKQIEGVSHRQAARILGVSTKLIFKA